MAYNKGTDKDATLAHHGTNPRIKPPSRSIDDFKAILSKGSGMARLAKYEVSLWPPLSLNKYAGQGEFATNLLPFTRDISLQCNTIAMPGHDLQTQTVQYGSQPAREMVTSHGYEGTIAATFYMDENLETKSYFDLWQHMAVDRNTNKVNYYKDYIGTMEIYQLGGGGRTYGMKVLEVYPETIGQIEYAYATVDTLALLPIEFQYRKWKTMDPRTLDRDGRGR
jgi:hypothetical protein